MIRNLKAFGFALMAMGALSAVAISTASATPINFHTDGPGVKLAWEQTGGGDKISTHAGQVSCHHLTGGSVVNGETAYLIGVVPTFDNCTAFGGMFIAEVTMNSCYFLYYTGETVGKNREGTIDIECLAGEPIEIHVKNALNVAKCTITIPAQTKLGSVTYTNDVSGDMVVDINVNNLKYTQHAGSGLGACAAVTAENGAYTGQQTVKGTNFSGGSTKIWVD